MKKKIAQWRKLERAALRASWGGTTGRLSGVARRGRADANGGCVGGQGLRERGVGRGRGVSEQGQAGGQSRVRLETDQSSRRRFRPDDSDKRQYSDRTIQHILCDQSDVN